MESNRLEQNICDTVKEWQMKIGYSPAPMELYYPAASLAQLLGLPERETAASGQASRQLEGEDTATGGRAVPDLEAALKLALREMAPRLGHIAVSTHDGRYCLRIPPEGCTYIHTQIPQNEFLKSFLEVMALPEVDIQTIREFFCGYNREVVEEREQDQEAGYIFYYPGGVPDEYVYCIHLDEFGATYHRFTLEDYRKLGL